MLGWQVQTQIHDEKIKLQVLDIDEGEKTSDNLYPLKIRTTEGVIDCQYFPVLGTRKATVFAGDIEGGFDSPANNLYGKLALDLNTDKISSLRVKYRYPGEMSECVLDVLAAIKFLEDEGITSVALVGYSFGAAVVIQAASLQPKVVKTVITLAAQIHGTEVITEFKKTSILLIHGRKDTVVSPHSSEMVYKMAHEPKTLSLIANTSHSLDEEANLVYEQIYRWLTTHL